MKNEKCSTCRIRFDSADMYAVSSTFLKVLGSLGLTDQRVRASFPEAVYIPFKKLLASLRDLERESRLYNWRVSGKVPANPGVVQDEELSGFMRDILRYLGGEGEDSQSQTKGAKVNGES